jgi:hypothetical protein
MRPSIATKRQHPLGGKDLDVIGVANLLAVVDIDEHAHWVPLGPAPVRRVELTNVVAVQRSHEADAV